MDRIKNLEAFYKHCDRCTQIEPKLKPVIAKYGYPPMWHRQPNFATLILTILEQQVSLASAKAAFIKLENQIGEVTPENILQLRDEDLRACYFSRQKTKYARILATEIIEGRLDLDSLNQMDEAEIRSRLITIKGIGHWTIDMYVLMSLLFADIFPPGDLATIKSVFEIELVAPESSKEDIVKYMEKFSPYRSAATYILWHSYIKKRNLILE
ncbi:DNA-3-methyladenine glycosylase 2 family protein [Maribellus comscasis]|uniref:DNA-3-methyladenine glycosylase II n=1 Tax=Maribellus comscasis TaxID=2681766 RepID=A0A6I6JQL3_9BACT|nr:DNA-3-methyladenine glycosylase 2 family protein [Maribellus comscasis]QGY43338.1 DNA-3-methyladenine glycosylase 2 family protein [Maribellus comscasis]